MSFTDYIPILMEYGSILFGILALLVFITNVVVEVIKGLCPMPTNILTFLVSEGVTVTAFAVAVKAMEISVSWCYCVGAVTLGVFVAYAAMYGFDKLKEAWGNVNKYL
jgi:hypothetical protein